MNAPSEYSGASKRGTEPPKPNNTHQWAITPPEPLTPQPNNTHPWAIPPNSISRPSPSRYTAYSTTDQPKTKQSMAYGPHLFGLPPQSLA